MESVKNHYDDFLGPLYSWILGDFENAYRSNVELFDTLDPGNAGIALDLGCGPGCQSIPLAERGYDVVAIDFCRELIDELRERAGRLQITPVCADILDFTDHVDTDADLVVCMGDTLVHLPDRDTVEALLVKIAGALRHGGTFIYSIRDYVSSVPSGADRFIPVRADDQQVFTCFLDYRDDTVHVHDLLYRREADGWRLQVSDYLKLRLDVRWIDEVLAANGLAIDRRLTHDGMLVTTATRTS